MLKEQFENVLADFGAAARLDLALDEDGTAMFVVDGEVPVSLKYLDQSDMVVAFSPIGGFGGVDAPDAGEKAMELLRMNDLDGESDGFTLAFDEEADLVLAMDRRSPLEMSSSDAFAAWIDALVRTVRAVRERFAARWPVEEEGRA